MAGFVETKNQMSNCKTRKQEISCFSFAAKLRTSMGMHSDQKYGKSFMTSHENSDLDNGDKMLII